MYIWNKFIMPQLGLGISQIAPNFSESDRRSMQSMIIPRYQILDMKKEHFSDYSETVLRYFAEHLIRYVPCLNYHDVISSQ